MVNWHLIMQIAFTQKYPEIILLWNNMSIAIFPGMCNSCCFVFYKMLLKCWLFTISWLCYHAELFIDFGSLQTMFLLLLAQFYSFQCHVQLMFVTLVFSSAVPLFHPFNPLTRIHSFFTPFQMVTIFHNKVYASSWPITDMGNWVSANGELM